MARKYGKKASEKVERTLHEWKRGKLRTSAGRKVTSREQAVAIGLAQARRKGYKVPAVSQVGHAKTRAQLDREIADALSRHGHSTKSSSYDKDDARMFGRYAYRMEQTKAQAQSNAKAEGFAAHHLAAVDDGWEAERRDTVHGGFAGTSHATRRKARGRSRSSHATKGVGETMFAVEIDRHEFDTKHALPAGARWREDLVHLAEEELGRGRTYRRPKDARYAVIEWTGYRAEVGRLLDWMEAAPGITRYGEIFE
jgi:hypothetical protein